MRSLTAQRGFSPIEMLVGLAIGLLLVMGLSEGITRQHMNARVQEELSRMEDAGRFALHAIERSLRQAGFVRTTARRRHHRLLLMPHSRRAL